MKIWNPTFVKKFWLKQQDMTQDGWEILYHNLYRIHNTQKFKTWKASMKEMICHSKLARCHGKSSGVTAPMAWGILINGETKTFCKQLLTSSTSKSRFLIPPCGVLQKTSQCLQHTLEIWTKILMVLQSTLAYETDVISKHSFQLAQFLKLNLRLQMES